jgi:hypothetical protein
MEPSLFLSEMNPPTSKCSAAFPRFRRRYAAATRQSPAATSPARENGAQTTLPRRPLSEDGGRPQTLP